MPDTPIVTLTPLDNAIEVEVANSDTPDLNEIWRSGGIEGLVCLSRDLGVDGTFTDYGVASDVEYSYFARAIDGGIEADSVSHSLSITLTECWAHVVDKNAGDSQRFGTGEVVLTNLPGQVRGPSRTTLVYRTGGRTEPVVSASDITDQTLQVNLAFTDDDDLATAQELFDTKRVWCVRDQHGLKLFGTVSGFPINYQATYSEVQLTLTEMDFSEHVEA